MAAHSVLSDAQLLLRIFASFGVDLIHDSTQLRRESRACLANASLVHHSVCKLALDELWARIDDLHPLAMLLPRNAYSVDEHKHTTVLRPLTGEDFIRFRFYLCRIKEVNRPDINPFQASRVFLPFLKAIGVHISGRDHSLEILKAISLLAPELQVFTYYNSQEAPECLPLVPLLALRRAVVSLSNLAVFASGVEIEDAELLQHLAALPRLAYLSIICSTSLSPPEWSAGAFPALEVFRLAAGSSVALTFLRSMRSSALEAILISFRDLIPNTIPIVGTLAFGGDFNRFLRSLILDHRMSNYPSIPLNLSELRILNHCSNLTSLIIRWPTMRVLDDDVLEISALCLRLERFELDIVEWEPELPMLSPHGLQALLENCPRLNTLVVTVDFSMLGASTFRPKPSPTMKWIDLGWSPYGNIELTTRFLQFVFPNLERFERRRADSAAWPEPWLMICANVLLAAMERRANVAGGHLIEQ